MLHSIILLISSIIFTNVLLQSIMYIFKTSHTSEFSEINHSRSGRRAAMGFDRANILKDEVKQLQYNGKRSPSTAFVSKSLTSRSIDATNIPIFSHGDIVQDFKLVQKLETLGLNKIYHSDVSWSANTVYLTSNTSVNGEKENSPDITENSLMKSSDLINQKSSRCLQNQTFCLEENIFHGGHGEIWRAHKVNRLGLVNYDFTYILKRMHVKDRDDILYCAKREIYFGNLLADRSSFARFITYFVTENDYWLVFHDEGISLQALIYAVTYNDDNAMLRPSKIWKKLRTTKSGETSMKGMMYQLIAGVAELHKEGIVHRDIKPSNILLNTEVVPKLLVADFSSGLQNTPIFEAQLLYSSRGPTTDEESLIYAPPEVLLAIDEEIDGPTSTSIPFYPSRPESYDLWSVGVLFLEMVLGTADIFTVDHRTAAILANKMRSKKQKRWLPKALLLASLAEFCIYRRASDDGAAETVVVPVSDAQLPNDDTSMLSIGDSMNIQGNIQSEVQFTSHHSEILNSGLLGSLSKLRTCGLEELSRAILKRDPLALGLRDKWAIDLLSKLLQFDPMKRISMTEALDHAYFQGAYVCERDGSEYATKDELLQRCEEEDFIVNLHNHSDGDEESATTVAVVSDTESPSLHLYIDENITEEVTLLSGQSSQQSSEDFNSNLLFQQQDPTTNIAFRCPSCGRIFLGDWQACQHHLKLRQHGRRCMYPVHALPLCLSEHSLLPMDPHSGWCDLQGRRKYIEDVHAMYFSENFKFFGVFDGHFGSQAAKFAATHLFGLFEHLIDISMRETSTVDDVAAQNSFMQLQEHLLDEANDKVNWRNNLRTADHFDVLLERMFPSKFLGDFISGENTSSDSEWFTSTDNSTSEYTAAGLYDEIFEDGRSEVTLTALQLSHIISEAFRLTNRQLFRKANQSLAGPSNITSGIGGTTATIVVEFQQYLMIAHVGDSRVVACCSPQSEDGSESQGGVRPIQLTLDHTPHLASEAASVRERGGWIDTKGTVPRVNGYLAVTRSLGDSFLGDVLSSVPDVLVLDILPQRDAVPSTSIGSDQSSSCGALYSIFNKSSLLFLIIASDGLWDVLSNDEAVELVCDSLSALVHRSDSAGLSESPEVTTLPANAFHEASKILAHEAYLRGSSDNIGVCVIDLIGHH